MMTNSYFGDDRCVCGAVPGDGGAGGDAAPAPGAGPGPEAQAGGRRCLAQGMHHDHDCMVMV
jgi:hypothetical protein